MVEDPDLTGSEVVRPDSPNQTTAFPESSVSTESIVPARRGRPRKAGGPVSGKDRAKAKRDRDKQAKQEKGEWEGDKFLASRIGITLAKDKPSDVQLPPPRSESIADWSTYLDEIGLDMENGSRPPGLRKRLVTGGFNSEKLDRESAKTDPEMGAKKVSPKGQGPDQ
jgi:hypothetical protein